MNTKTRESTLCGTFIDAVIRPILDDPDNEEFLVWSNLKVPDKSDDRPGFSGLVSIDSKLDGPTCVGEVKGEDRLNNTYASALRMMKVAVFSKEVVDERHLKGVLGIHVIGFHLPIYITTLLAEGLYVMYEIASIRIPANLYDIKSFVANLEDLLPVKNNYKRKERAYK